MCKTVGFKQVYHTSATRFWCIRWWMSHTPTGSHQPSTLSCTFCVQFSMDSIWPQGFNPLLQHFFYIFIVRGLSPLSSCPVYMDFTGTPLKLPVYMDFSGSPLTPCTLAVYMDFTWSVHGLHIHFHFNGLAGKVLVQSMYSPCKVYMTFRRQSHFLKVDWKSLCSPTELPVKCTKCTRSLVIPVRECKALPVLCSF